MRAIIAMSVVISIGLPANLLGAAEADRAWSNVKRLEPATELVVSVRGVDPEPRVFLFADDSALFVLDTTTVSLPREAQRDIRSIIESHAAELLASERVQFVVGDVRISNDAVFLADRRI